MNTIKTLNYPGVLRAYNRIEESSAVENKIEILSTLTSMIDRVIRMDLECVRQQHEAVSKNVAVTEEEIKKLLIALEESDVVLYEGLTNEDALVVKKHYRAPAPAKTKMVASKYRVKAKA